MKNIAIISARMGSKRFPGKVLKPLWKDKSVLEVLIERLRLSKRLDDIVVATTTEPEDEQIYWICSKIDINCFCLGNSQEAITSVINASKYIEDILKEEINIIDITSDCPFIDPYQVDQMIDYFEKFNYDYLSNCMIRSFPRGFDIQIYKSSLLYKIDKLLDNPTHREHSGWNIWTHSSLLQNNITQNYKFGNICADEEYFYPDWRVTLDTKEDLDLLKEIIKFFNSIDFDYKDVICYLKNHQELLETNKHIKQKIAGKKY